jgi:hypothetical protein
MNKDKALSKLYDRARDCFRSRDNRPPGVDYAGKPAFTVPGLNPACVARLCEAGWPVVSPPKPEEPRD